MTSGNPIGQIDQRLYGTAAEEESSLVKNPELETTWQAETVLLALYSGPLMLTYVLQYSFQLATVFGRRQTWHKGVGRCLSRDNDGKYYGTLRLRRVID